MKVAVIGLGKLGCPLAACYAAAGHTVVGVDKDPEVVQMLNKGIPSVSEPGLGELVSQHRRRITATTNTGEAVQNAQIIFIIVPTPSKTDGCFSLEYVLSAAKEIGPHLNRHNKPIIVLTSTVMPGNTRSGLVPALEASSNMHCNEDFYVGYSPEFIALGEVIRGLRYPDLVLIGASHPEAGERLKSFFRSVVLNDPPIKVMNLVNAEIAKLSVNTFVTTKISYANMLAEICEGLPNADVDVVTDALSLDSRIGGKYLKGATGYGGPCFPRDNRAFAALAQGFGEEADLATATDCINQRQAARLAQRLKALLHEGGNGTIALLGMTYKPATAVTEESQGLAIKQQLEAEGLSIVCHDPEALDFKSDLDDVLKTSDVIAVLVPWPRYRVIKPADLKPDAKVLDPWRCVDARLFNNNNLFYTGKG